MVKTHGASTTAAEVASDFAAQIRDKVVLVTGTTLGGIGEETARVIATHNARLLIITGRSESALKKTKDAILAESPRAKIECIALDLASLASVRAAVAQVLALDVPIHVLINNAGVMGLPYTLTPDGFEAHFGSNHLGPFLFTQLLKPALFAARGSRVVNVGSSGNRWTDVREDIYFNQGKSYDWKLSYGGSKTANSQFAVAIARRWKVGGVNAFSLHPGVVTTNLANDMSFWELAKQLGEYFGQKIGSVFSSGLVMDGKLIKSVAQGASTTIEAAFNPMLDGQSGSFLMDCKVNNINACPPYCLDEADRLWKMSEELLGETFE